MPPFGVQFTAFRKPIDSLLNGKGSRESGQLTAKEGATMGLERRKPPQMQRLRRLVPKHTLDAAGVVVGYFLSQLLVAPDVVCQLDGVERLVEREYVGAALVPVQGGVRAAVPLQRAVLTVSGVRGALSGHIFEQRAVVAKTLIHFLLARAREPARHLQLEAAEPVAGVAYVD